jgi:hypothetical protein
MSTPKRMAATGIARGVQDPAFQAELGSVLRCCHRQAADPEEVLATVARITDGDPDSWLHEWMSTAGAVWAAAVKADRHGREQDALARYRRAGTYYAAALSRVLHSTEPERRLDIWRRQRECWERLVDLAPGGAQRLAIPYGDTTLPGFFFPARGAAAAAPRPVVIINHGADDATSQAWVNGGAAAAERGYHWMTFDGPGQQAALFEQGLLLRPDWEAVLTPVVDAVLATPGVDPRRIGLIGIGIGGGLAVRALCFEHRIAAAVADPGVVDVSTSWTEALPDAARRLLDEGRETAFNREAHLMELFTPDVAATTRSRGTPFGLANGSRYALYQRVRRYRLGDELEQMITPLLVVEPEPDQSWPGQSRRLHERLPGATHLIRLAAAGHADPEAARWASAQRETLLYDWLREHLEPGRHSR